MPSENKTPNIDLNHWQGNEYPKRQDFVEDNLKIDEAIGKLSSLTTEDKTSLVSAINEVNSKEVDLTSVNERIDENVNEISTLDGKIEILSTNQEQQALELQQLENDLTSHKAEDATDAHLPQNVGLGNVDNKSSHTIRTETGQLRVEVVSSFPAHADGKIIAHTGDKKAYVSIDGEWV